MADWIDELTADDFPEMFAPFLDVLGIRKTVELAERMGGMQFYLPKADKLRMAAVRRMIKADRRNGAGYRQLAVKYQVSENFVRAVCDQAARERTIYKQMALF